MTRAAMSPPSAVSSTNRARRAHKKYPPLYASKSSRKKGVEIFPPSPSALAVSPMRETRFFWGGRFALLLLSSVSSMQRRKH